MNAIRTVMPGVKKIARQMDKQLAKARARGTALPPLFCVPSEWSKHAV